MAWKKLNEYAQIWKKPVLGSEDRKDGKRYMALCVDPASKSPYRGIARQVTERVGNVDIPGFLDMSKLVVVESYDLLRWEVVRDLEIGMLESAIRALPHSKRFMGPQDPDILTDNKGLKHIYFTIPLKYPNKAEQDVYLGHAEGDSLQNLRATNPVLGKVNAEIVGFKEICHVPIRDNGQNFILAETFVNRGKERRYSAISLLEIKSSLDNWEYIKLVHDPENEKRKWCAGHSSPCRIFAPDYLSHNGYLVGIMNGREPTKKINGKRVYGKFRPGLFLFDNKSGDIVWIDNEPLLEDPIATTVTFASDLVYLTDKEAILYAHPNDSFVRAYKLNLGKIKKRLENKC